VRHEASRHFRNIEKEYLKDKFNELAIICKNKNIRGLFRGIHEFKRGYQLRNNLVKDELLNVHNVSDVRQIEMHTTEPLVAEPSRLEVEIAIAELKKYKSTGSDQILAKLIQAGGEILL
jgi:hypothetical protein